MSVYVCASAYMSVCLNDCSCVHVSSKKSNRSFLGKSSNSVYFLAE